MKIFKRTYPLPLAYTLCAKIVNGKVIAISGFEVWNHTYIHTMEPVYYGHLGTNQRCPDYQGVLIFQVSLYDKAPFGTIARCPDYAGAHIFKCPD